MQDVMFQVLSSILALDSPTCQGAAESVAADTTYGNGEFLQWLQDRDITPYMRTRESIHRKRSPYFGPERFTYEPEHNRYICPAGCELLHHRYRINRNSAREGLDNEKNRNAAGRYHDSPARELSRSFRPEVCATEPSRHMEVECHEIKLGRDSGAEGKHSGRVTGRCNGAEVDRVRRQRRW